MKPEATLKPAPGNVAVPIWRFTLVKALAIQIIFLILHYAYESFPSIITTIFSGINESVYQHLKMGFFAYALTSVIEYLFRHKAIVRADDFFFTRLFTTFLYPWIILILFLIPPAQIGQYHSIALEAISAFDVFAQPPGWER